ncbi:hypothetical protein MMC25_001199 [Agyrium rufum]|nr:hypothetical protein [Agyrium rufum]
MSGSKALDPAVAKAIDQSLAPKASSDDEDDLLNSLENETDPNMVAYRAARLQQMSSEMTRAKALKSESQHGVVTTCTEEKPLMDSVVASRLSLVHFFHLDFARCSVMDRHLSDLAPLHYEVRFLRIDVQYAPFLCEKLGVKVLPCLLGFLDGAVKERLVGFEGLGGTENFKTAALEKRLVEVGIFARRKWEDQHETGNKTVRSSAPSKNEDEDDDWD